MMVISVESSATVREFDGADSMNEREALLGAQHVSPGGVSFIWRLGQRWEGSLYAEGRTMVSSADASLWNDWWRRQAELVVTFTHSTTPVSVFARIVNGEQPFGEQVRGTLLWQGLVQLQGTTGEARVAYGPFILDDATWGLTDQTYNALT